MNSSKTLTGPRFEIDIDSECYPPILRDTPDPPKKLYGLGNPDALEPGVAIIGARKATPYGLSCAEYFADIAARRGLTIVSGGARGCDSAAHKAALAANASTVVVLAGGADVVYPRSGYELFSNAIVQGGAVVSEQAWGTPPLRAMFVQRNRIIAGLAMLTLIVEAGLPSGTFTTADAALQANRDVAVIPGAITSPNSKGANHLLSQGAMAVVDAESFDVALELANMHCPYTLMSDAGEEEDMLDEDEIQNDPILQALAAQGYSPDELTAYFGFSTSQLASALSRYEMLGLVERGYDGRYQVCLHRSKRG